MSSRVITVGGDPVTKARPRSGNGRTYTPARTVNAEKAVRQVWVDKHGPGVTYPKPANLAVDLYFACATRRRADIDNLTKLVLDALNGCAYDDDSQITKLYVEVRRGVGIFDCGTDITVMDL